MVMAAEKQCWYQAHNWIFRLAKSGGGVGGTVRWDELGWREKSAQAGETDSSSRKRKRNGGDLMGRSCAIVLSYHW